MQVQNIVIAHPKNVDQVDALKAILKALKIKFEITAGEEPYNPEFVEKVLQGDEDFKAGKGRKITIEELNSLWK